MIGHVISRKSIVQASLLVAASLLSGVSWGQLKGETLVATIPTGFKMGSHSDQDGVTLLEWLRATESPQNWTEKVTVLIDHRPNAMTPAQVLHDIGTKWLASCKDSAVNQISDGQANGYAVSMLLVHCPLNPKSSKPETTLLRVIKGADALYSIQKTFRFDPSNAQLGQIMKYLNSVNVCDTQHANHPCPKVD